MKILVISLLVISAGFYSCSKEKAIPKPVAGADKNFPKVKTIIQNGCTVSCPAYKQVLKLKPENQRAKENLEKLKE